MPGVTKTENGRQKEYFVSDLMVSSSILNDKALIDNQLIEKFLGSWGQEIFPAVFIHC